MNIPIGKMTVGDILDRGLKLLFARLPAFYLINLLVLSPLIVYQVVLPFVLDGADNQQTAALMALGSSLGLVVLAVILAPIGTAATLYLVMQEFVGRRPTAGEALGQALRHFGALLGTSILVGLVVGLGFVACIAPGVYFAVSYALVGQVVVLEGLSANRAMSRSSELVTGYRGRVLGIILLVGVAGAVVQGLIGAGLQIALPSQVQVPTPNGIRLELVPLNHIVDTVVTQLAGILFSTFQAVCTTLVYLDLRIRKEGFDLELAARGGGPADDLPPPDDRP